MIASVMIPPTTTLAPSEAIHTYAPYNGKKKFPNRFPYIQWYCMYDNPLNSPRAPIYLSRNRQGKNRSKQGRIFAQRKEKKIDNKKKGPGRPWQARGERVPVGMRYEAPSGQNKYIFPFL